MKNNAKIIAQYLIIIFTSLALLSCSTYRPIFDPNLKYQTAGDTKAQSDAKACQKEADQYLKAVQKRRMLKEAGRSAIMGSIIGGIFGFLVGSNARSLISGVAIGTGLGVISGAGGVAAEDRLKPAQIKQRYVGKCLAQQGYEIIGWE